MTFLKVKQLVVHLLNIGVSFSSEACASKVFVGSKAVTNKTITKDDVNLFGHLIGDLNPIHFVEEKSIVHGALLNGLVSGVIGTKLPGPGTLVVKQTLRYPKSCYVGDTVSVSVEIKEVRRLVSCEFSVVNLRNEEVVLEGTAQLIVPK